MLDVRREKEKFTGIVQEEPTARLFGEKSFRKSSNTAKGDTDLHIPKNHTALDLLWPMLTRTSWKNNARMTALFFFPYACTPDGLGRKDHVTKLTFHDDIKGTQPNKHTSSPETLQTHREDFLGMKMQQTSQQKVLSKKPLCCTTKKIQHYCDLESYTRTSSRQQPSCSQTAILPNCSRLRQVNCCKRVTATQDCKCSHLKAYSSPAFELDQKSQATSVKASVRQAGENSGE